ncbi:MAG: ChaN family lipoprotein [Bacteroidota bacterium]
MKKLTMLLVAGLIAVSASAQKPAYQLYRESGKKVKYQKMVEAASGADIVLFGEQHTNPISHWLQLELTQDLHQDRGDNLVLGAEMFEADNQLILNEYLADLITETKFEEEARLWKNYPTDYKPLVLFAKENELAFIATNIPRRYANSVFKQGVSVLDSLSEEAKVFIAPLPLEYDTSLNCYNQLIHGDEMGGPGSINMADAQAIKDATMTHFIMESWQPGKILIHYNGAYHSDEFESMNWFLLKDNPELKIVTISTVYQDDVTALEEESQGKADFIICVPSSMTKTMR